MKFSKKSAALAVALASVWGAAQAASSSDLFAVVYDPTSKDTFLADVGPMLTNANSPSTISLSGFSAWSTFTADATGAASTWDWALIGGSLVTGAADYTQQTSSGTFASSTGIYTKAQMESLFSAIGPDMSSAVGSTGSAVIASGAVGSYTTLVGSLDDFGFGTGGVVGGTGPAYLTYQNTSANDYLLGTGTFNTTTDQIVFPTAAVPEPGTYALMAAGLLAVGAIVRRRSRA